MVDFIQFFFQTDVLNDLSVLDLCLFTSFNQTGYLETTNATENREQQTLLKSISSQRE